MKILLADDSMTAQRMGAKILSEAGHEVVVVSNGAAAARKMLEFCPDAVVLDVYMPGYNGLELCERIKKTRETAHIPVLLTVGKLEPFRPEEGKRVHADAVVIKPFEASELLRSIGSITGEIARDSGNSKRPEKSLAAPVLKTADPPVPQVAHGPGSPASTSEGPTHPEEGSASQVPGSAESSIAHGSPEERVAPVEVGILASDSNPVLETPTASASPLPPPLSTAVFVVEPIEINAADQESLEASAATLETAPALASEPPPQIPQESFTIALQAAAAEPQVEPSADNPSERASVADQEAPREVAVAATASIEPAVVVVDPPPANAAAPEPCGIAVVPSELACSAAGEVPVFPIEEIPVPEPPVAETKTEPSEVVSRPAVCAPIVEVGPSCQPTPAPQMWNTQAEPPRSEPNEAPAAESSQFTDDSIQPAIPEAAVDFVADEAPVTSVEQVEPPMPPESGEDFPEPAEGDVAPERSAELAAVAAIVGLVPTAISAETSIVSIGAPSPTEPAHDEEGAPHLPGFGRCGLAAGSSSPAPTQISAVDFLGTPTWAALAEELIAQNPKLLEDASGEAEMAAPVPPPPEADNIPAPEPASAASLPVLDEERVAAIVDVVLERLKPQLVAEIVRELCSKA